MFNTVQHVYVTCSAMLGFGRRGVDSESGSSTLALVFCFCTHAIRWHRK